MEIQILSHHIFWYIILIIVAIVAGIISYRRSFPPLEPFWRLFLAALRAAMILLLAVFLVEPLINLYSSKTIKPRLAILMDTSKSMSVRDRGEARISLADSLIKSDLPRLDGEYGIFDFSTGLNEAGELPDESRLSGDATSIANALQDFGARKDIDTYGAIVIVTDGRQNLGEDPVASAAKLNIPVYTLTVGEYVEERNLSIDHVVYPAVTYSGSKFKVDVEVSAGGVPQGKSRLFVKLGSSAAGEKPFDIPEENRKIKVGFDITAPEPGNYEYVVSTPVLSGEVNRADNERIFAVRVLKNKVKILLAASSLDWEFKFLKQSLGAFEEFDVDAVYPESPGNFSEPGTPRGLDGLKKYDVVVLVDSSPGDLRIQSADLERYIADGGSLVYVAGSDCINDIRMYGNLLPVTSEKPAIVAGEFFFDPSPTRKQHAAILLDDDPDASVRLWQSLPPFDDIVTGIAATGEVLLEANPNMKSASDIPIAPGKKGPEPIPVLTAGNHGKGRVAAITGFPWWKSYFVSVRNESTAKVIPEFWRNLIRWASSTEGVQNFRILTDRKVYRLGEPIRFTGYLYDQANRPKNGAFVSVSISPQGQENGLKEVVLPPIDNGIYGEQVSSLAPGKYSFKATASSYGDTLGRTSGEFTVESYSLEMASSAPDYNLTRRISEATGAVAYSRDDFNRFPDQLKLTPYVKETQASIKPFGLPLLLIILLAGLCLEWGLRKRFRLP